MSSEKYYTPAEIAEDWQCCLETVYDLLRAGKLRGFKLGKSWRITASARVEYETCGGVPDLPKRKATYSRRPVLRVT